MATLSLALALFASVLGVGNLVLGVYTLIRLHERPSPAPINNHYHPAQPQGHDFYGDIGGKKESEDNLGMPSVYDPEEDGLDAGMVSEGLGI